MDPMMCTAPAAISERPGPAAPTGIAAQNCRWHSRAVGAENVQENPLKFLPGVAQKASEGGAIFGGDEWMEQGKADRQHRLTTCAADAAFMPGARAVLLQTNFSLHTPLTISSCTA